MLLLDVLGRRWNMRIIWELRGKPLTFRELQQRCDGMSPSVLNQRLYELREITIVETVDEGYALTSQGRELMDLFGPLNRWAESWAKRKR
jgi:DNA-binding HxlR family transcriptional regulator